MACNSLYSTTDPTRLTSYSNYSTVKDYLMTSNHFNDIKFVEQPQISRFTEKLPFSQESAHIKSLQDLWNASESNQCKSYANYIHCIHLEVEKYTSHSLAHRILLNLYYVQHVNTAAQRFIILTNSLSRTMRALIFKSIHWRCFFFLSFGLYVKFWLHHHVFGKFWPNYFIRT